MKKKWMKCVMAVTACLLLAGCGSSATKYAMTEAAAYDTAEYDTGNLYTAEETAVQAMAGENAEGTGNPAVVQDTSRKLIRNVELEVETEAFDELLRTIENKTSAADGYIEASYTYNGSSYYGHENRNANLTLRIPAEKLDEFLFQVGEVSNIISRNENITDVTLQYVDMESHKNALKTEQERLLDLLKQAESVEDIITIESRLSEVRYQLESMESQLRTMDNKVSYSTVYLYINEVARLTPVQEQTAWEKIQTGFANSLYHIDEGFKNFGISFAINLPYLIVWTVILGIAGLLIYLILRKRARRKEKKSAKEALKQGADRESKEETKKQQESIIKAKEENKE